MITLEDRIRDVLAGQAAAMPVELPESPPPSRVVTIGTDVRRHRPTHSPVLVAAAAIALIACGGVLAAWRTNNAVLSPQPTGTFLTLSSTPTSTTRVPATTTGPVSIVIPPPESASDHRDPLQRVLGTPADIAAGTRLDHDRTEQAIKECMNTNGYDYTPVPFPDGSTAAGQVDVNQAYSDGLPTAERLRYLTVRSGGPDLPADQSCEATATRRVFLYNAYPNLADDLQQRFESDPRVIAARAQVTACILAAGQDPQQPDQPARPGCEMAANLPAIGDTARAPTPRSV